MIKLSLLVLLTCSLASCATEQEIFPATTSRAEYKKAVEDRLGPLWYRRVELNERGASLGTVTASFRIPAKGGRVRKVQIISSTGNVIDEQMVRTALEQLRAPPIPPALLKNLQHDYFVFEESFTIFDKNEPTPAPRKR